jgi:hypothetical protein
MIERARGETDPAAGIHRRRLSELSTVGFEPIDKGSLIKSLSVESIA